MEDENSDQSDSRVDRAKAAAVLAAAEKGARLALIVLEVMDRAGVG